MKYVILDIETTGLDREFSSVLEVGAILVSGNTVLKRWSTFVRYSDEIPETIKRITGITEKDVCNAPTIEEVIKQTREFIKGYTVVSHNGFSFDFPILEREGLKFDDKQDSLEFAFFILPTNPFGHSTTALSEYFKLESVRHRALQDCESEFEIIKNLQALYVRKPLKHRSALRYLSERVNWWWKDFLPARSEDIIDISHLVEPFQSYRKPVGQNTLGFKANKEIKIEDVEKYFDPAIDKSGNYSEARPEQKKMAAAIAFSFNNKKHAVIEAGTGTGKSKAYLAPSVLFALENNIPVIISTHTKALQDQLAFKEIPHLCELMGKELHVAVLKGKKNYVCLSKFSEFIEEIIAEGTQRSLYEFKRDGIRFTRPLSGILLSSWVLETTRGDWGELPYWLTERMPKKIEHDVCNTDELCTQGVCDLFGEGKCFLAKAKLRARDADLVVVNHAIMLSGIVPAEEKENDFVDEENSAQKHAVSFSHTVFPGEAKYIVFDEAHHLEEDATSAWEQILSKDRFILLEQHLFGKGKRKGVANIIENIAKQKNENRLSSLSDSFFEVESNLNLDITSLFDEITPKLVSKPNDKGYSQYSLFSEMNKDGLTALQGILIQIRDRLASIQSIMEVFAKETKNEQQQKILTIRIRTVKQIIDTVIVFINTSPAYIKYLERTNSGVEIKGSLLSVAKELNEKVYQNYSSVVLTSATLTIDKKFNFFSSRCGLGLIEKGNVKGYIFSSSFDYDKQAKFFLPKGISFKTMKGDRHFNESVDFLEKAIIASNGGALILCTSFDQVNKIYEKLVRPLSKKNLWLLKQSRGQSCTSVIRDFSSDTNSVLIGTETLWQGVDVPGNSLRSLFIYKTPYRNPNLPIIQARCKELDNKRLDGFKNYYQPLAVMLFKQGFGRLIRKRTDVGIAVMLEDQLLDSPIFINSLPEGVTPERVEAETIFKELEDLAKACLACP
ncbi:MAG: exonuclease domain-containing protein [Candidatus Parcubacteria bacterium]|nr:exonuclease domain-containing protein [Candidatus Parcubacteria bacterium]